MIFWHTNTRNTRATPSGKKNQKHDGCENRFPESRNQKGLNILGNKKLRHSTLIKIHTYTYIYYNFFFMRPTSFIHAHCLIIYSLFMRIHAISWGEVFGEEETPYPNHKKQKKNYERRAARAIKSLKKPPRDVSPTHNKKLYPNQDAKEVFFLCILLIRYVTFSSYICFSFYHKLFSIRYLIRCR